MAAAGKTERVLLIGCAAVLVATSYNAIVQRAAVPTVMRYVPPESAAYVVTSPLNALWDGLDPHLRPFFQSETGAGKRRGADAEPTFAVQLADEIQKTLDEKKISLAKADDLAALGVDPGANAAFALVGGLRHARTLMVAPLVDRALFVATLTKLTGEPVEPDASAKDARFFRSGDLHVAFDGDAIAVLSDDGHLLRRVLDTQQENLAYFRSNDGMIRGFAALLPSRQGRSGAWLRGMVRMGNFSLPFLRETQFVLAPDSRTLAFRAKVGLQDGGSALLVRALAKPTPQGAPAREILARSNGAAVLDDDSLSYYLRQPWSSALLESFVKLTPLASVLLMDEIGSTHSLSRLSLTANDESQRVPGFLLGLGVSHEDAQDLVFRLQRQFRIERDERVLSAAAERYRTTPSEAAPAASPTVDDLLRAGLLSPRRDPLWSRYRFDHGKVIVASPIEQRDFANGSYTITRGPHTLRYVLPPFTHDDLAYRIPEEDRARIAADELLQDRYRACSGYVAGTLWMGNDAEVVTRWLDRLSDTGTDSDYDAVTALTEGAGAAKLRWFVRPRELLDAGQLHPDPRVNKQTRLFLSDLRHYRALLVVAWTDGVERELDVSGTLLRF